MRETDFGWLAEHSREIYEKYAGKWIAVYNGAVVGVAQPVGDERYGFLSEHHSYGETDEKCGDYAEDLAATMLASSLGIEFDTSAAWDEREMVYKASGQIFRTSNFTQSAIGDKNGLWTTVVAAGVFLP